MNAADYYDDGVTLAVKDSAGVTREYVPLATYDRVIAELQQRLESLAPRNDEDNA